MLKILKEILRELPRLICDLIKPCGIKDDLLKLPKSLNKMGTTIGVIGLTTTIVALIFSYMLKLTNIAIEAKFILLGIICFMLYRGQNVIGESFNLFEATERKKFETLFDNEVVLRGSKIISKASDRVLKFDSSSKVYKVLTNEAALNAIKSYLNNLWLLKINKKFKIIEIVSAIAMLATSIITNTEISQKVFIPLILSFAMLSFFASAYISTNRNSYYKSHRQYGNEQYVITNDLLRTPAIVKRDLPMRIEKLKVSMQNSSKNLINFHKKINISHLVMSIVETMCAYAVIVVYMLNVDFASVSLATITQISANLIIVETALGYIRRVARMLESNSEMVGIIQREEEDMKLILDVYNKETNEKEANKCISEINISPFKIKYVEESENDKPFTLKSKHYIRFKKGDVIILYGVSGSGKSTFMKMITERIKVEKTTEIPSTSRYLYYDEKMKLGSLSIYEEIFCCEENPDLLKMQEILINLHLWQELSANCIDIWQFFKEKKYDLALSNGQKQRLIIAKMLYWLDDKIDVVVFDECTSGLDDKSEVVESADAQRILEYVVNYCNKDKKRIVILSTHQAIDEFKQNIKSNYNIQNLYFSKQGDCNFVEV